MFEIFGIVVTNRTKCSQISVLKSLYLRSETKRNVCTLHFWNLRTCDHLPLQTQRNACKFSFWNLRTSDHKQNEISFLKSPPLRSQTKLNARKFHFWNLRTCTHKHRGMLAYFVWNSHADDDKHNDMFANFIFWNLLTCGHKHNEMLANFISEVFVLAITSKTKCSQIWFLKSSELWSQT